MKKIILILIAILSLNVNAQEIYTKKYYSNYKKNIKKLELFLESEGYKKIELEKFYYWTETSYHYVFIKNKSKIFIMINRDNRWLDCFADIEHYENASCNYFSNKLKTFINKDNENIYIIKRS